ncbi:hypothetical protein [Paraburkholderia sp. BL17N1]|uniref:hypothetical protein n=2 Tax=unclassified Paraburkholderia TaxID=2615204 RepID=UPI000EB19C6E|nr:hypothetical protein [Paraburkholderia sp. BL17N1]RKR31571.1 hypothetical protein B0G82_7765 [Paraburkholderia sp. BL17N1]
MLRWITNWASHHAPTPEKRSERALNELRMELFQAEQRVLDAQMHADYYRSRIAFCEAVFKQGIEQVSDQRKRQEDAVHELRPGLRLTATQ